MADTRRLPSACPPSSDSEAAGPRSDRDHEDTKNSKDHEEELVFFVIFVGFRAFVVSFRESRLSGVSWLPTGSASPPTGDAGLSSPIGRASLRMMSSL